MAGTTLFKGSLKYHLVDNGDDDSEKYQPSSYSSSFSCHTSRTLLAFLAVSLLANVGLLFEKLTATTRSLEQSSKYGA